MIAYCAMIIPLITAVFVLYFHWNKLSREVLVPLLVSFIACFLVIVSVRESIKYSLTADVEYWNGYIKSTEHREDWTEVIVETSTDSKGNVTTTTRYVYHPDEYYVYDSNGIFVSCYKEEYQALSRKAISKSKRYVNSTVHVSHLSENPIDYEVCTTSHTYRNKVIASDSVFSHRKVPLEEKQRFGLYDYPKKTNSWYINPILGFDDGVAERKLSVLNATFGKSKQITTWILVFKDQPMDAALAQADYWQGSNKNELVLCIGIDSTNKVQWGYVISWTDKEVFKSTVCSFITNQTGKDINLSKIIDELNKEIPQGWERKRFEDFDYLTVDLPSWTNLLIYFLVMLVSGGSVFAIFKLEQGSYRSYRFSPSFSSKRKFRT